MHQFSGRLRNKFTIPAIASIVVGFGMTIVFSFLPDTDWITPERASWFVTVGLVVVASGVVLGLYGIIKTPVETKRDDGTTLLYLLDEGYKNLKEITRLTIRKLRRRGWGDIQAASADLMWLTDMDVESAIEGILIKNVHYFTTGRRMTYVQDSQQLATKIRESPLFTRNPEDIARDASIILREKVPYLKKRIERDRTYNKLQKRIERERDKYPSEAVSNAIDAYLDHSIKINAAWVLSEHDLDFVGDVLPMKFKVILMGLPGRMDEEMRRLRNKVAIAILGHLEGRGK